ncbi:MAG: DUF1684 domain-containing protein [candidate division KSB1 bacterium]|nr:DUF1684 domain-containing protein [candidate division KSB1 bacterium]
MEITTGFLEHKQKAAQNCFGPLLVLMLLTGSQGIRCSRAQQADPHYIQEIRAWHQRRIERLTQPEGWLSLVGLHWLNPGENRFGSDPSNDLVFPEKAPKQMGSFFLEGREIRVEIREGIEVRCGDSLVKSMRLQTDEQGPPSVLRWGTLSWYVIRRGDRYAVRVKDSESPTRLQFKGIEMFPIDPRWRIKARFEPYPSPRRIPVPTVVGTIEEMISPGTLAFEVKGKTYRLQAFREEGDTGFFVVFGDRTNGAESYGAGRFLAVDAPAEDNTTWIDFNKAYNPPCAFTPYATCPLPPEENVLPIRIPAGEKKYGRGHP